MYTCFFAFGNVFVTISARSSGIFSFLLSMPIIRLKVFAFVVDLGGGDNQQKDKMMSENYSNAYLKMIFGLTKFNFHVA